MVMAFTADESVETLADIVIKDLEIIIFSFLQQTMRNRGFISEVWC